MSKKNIQKKKPEQVSLTYKGFFSPNEYRNLFIILFAGLVLRLIFFFEIKNSPLYSILFSDSKIFIDLAKEIASNKKWFGDIVFYMSPGYTYFLAAVDYFFGHVLSLIRILQILINTANILIIYLIGRELFSSKAGYAAAIIAAFYSVFIFYSSLILLEIILTFFISLLLLNLIRSGNKKDKKYWFFTGALLGIAALFRGNILLCYPFILLWLILYKEKGLLLLPKAKAVLIPFTLGVIIPILPVTINNYIAGKEFILLTSNAGINFFIGNHPDATGIYKIPEGIDLSLDPTGEKFAENTSGRNLNSSEVSDFWFNKGSGYLLSEPLQGAGLFIKKVFLFFDNRENPQSSIMDMDFYRDNYSFLLKLPLPAFYFVFLLSMGGLILSFKKEPKLLLIYFILISYILGTVIFFVTGRFRVAVTPVFIVFSGYAVIRIYELFRGQAVKKLILPGTAVLIFIIINFFIVEKYSFSSYDAYITFGNSFFEKQEYDEALSYYKKSLELNEESGTYVLIGNTLSVKKDVKGAFASYKKALELDPVNPLAHFNIGTLFVQTSNYNKAIEAFRAVIMIDSSFADAYRNLGIIYYMKENFRESLHYFEKYLYLANDDRAKETVKKDIEEIKKRLN